MTFHTSPWRMTVGLVALLGLWACGEADKKAPPAVTDGGPADAAGHDDGATGSGGAGGAADAAGGDAGPGGDAFVPMPDAGSGGMGDAGGMGGAGGDIADIVPEWNQVGVAVSEDSAWVAWVQEGTLLTGRLGSDGTWLDPIAPLARLDADPLDVAALSVNAVPWIAYDQNGTVQLLQADLGADQAPIELAVRGPALLAALGDRLLVVGHLPGAGGGDVPAWQIVGADDTTESLAQPVVGPDRMPLPDSAVGISGGVLLRFGVAGECLQLGPEGAVVASVACSGGDGTLVGTPDTSPLVFHRQVEANGDVRLQIIPAFGATHYLSYNVGLAPHAMTPPAYPPVGGERVVLVRGISRSNPQDPPNPRQDQDYLAVVGPTRLALGDPTPVWQDDDTRAAVPFGDTLYLLRFGQPGGPVAMPAALEDKAFSGGAYGFGLQAACAPTAELCDGVDADCDGRPDNGRCCGQGEPLRGEPTVVGQPTEIHVTEVEDRQGVRVAMRDATGHWTAFGAIFEDGAIRINDDPHFDFHGGPAAAYVAVGGPSLLLLQNDDGLTAQWYYPPPSRRPIKPAYHVECSRFLAAAPLDHTGPDESVLVACADKFIRTSPWNDGEHDDVDYPITGLPAGGADWITLNRPFDADSVEAFVGFTDDMGQHQIRHWTITAAGRVEQQRQLPSALQHVPPADAGEPIWAAPPVYRVAFQQRVDAPARMWLKIAGEYRWVDLRFNTDAQRVAYSRSLPKAFSSAVVDDHLAVWVVDVSDDESPNPWSWEPAFTVPSAEALWDVHNGDYDHQFIALYPDAGAAHGWRLEAYDVDCESP